MTDATQDLPLPAERPPTPSAGVVSWLRANLFNGVGNTLLTLAAAWFLVMTIPRLVRWAVVDAVWHADSGRACRGERRLLGVYRRKAALHPVRAVSLCGAMAAAARRADLYWINPGELRPPFVGPPAHRSFGSAGLMLVGVLMRGGILGMSYVETDLWNGLPLTLILAVVGMALAFPLAILLALGRRSELPAVRAICVAYIELIRGVPLITVLFMASVMLPLFLPTGMTIDKLLRAQVAFILFAAAYLAEVVRGGLQAIPKGQIEAADALGLGYWQRTRLIVLPQALALVIPPLGQHFHRHFQGHLAGHRHRPFRPARHRQRGVDRRELARFLRRGLCLRGGDLLHLLFLHVALQPNA